jgi:peptidyl-prolyl cis-trans isomerase B (cyclophilin B)
MLLGGLPACEGQQAKAPAGKDFLVTIETEYGPIYAVLHDQTPSHKANFVKLAKKGYYDSLLFHRVIPEFMVQGGDPTSKTAPPDQPLGNNGPGYTQPAEIVPQFYHGRGAISAARKPDQINPKKESDGGQFFIVQGKKISQAELEAMKVDLKTLYQYFVQLAQRPGQETLRNGYMQAEQTQDEQQMIDYILKNKDLVEATFNIEVDRPMDAQRMKVYQEQGGAPFLDGGYTIFGQVVSGMEVVDKITAQPRDGRDRPQQNIRMKVKVTEMTRAAITKRFGYVYPAPAVQGK